MARKTQEGLDQALKVINGKLGTDYILSGERGKKRLCTADQSRELSPLLGRGDLYRWMEAFDAGIDAMHQRVQIVIEVRNGVVEDVRGLAPNMLYELVDRDLDS